MAKEKEDVIARESLLEQEGKHTGTLVEECNWEWGQYFFVKQGRGRIWKQIKLISKRQEFLIWFQWASTNWVTINKLMNELR